MRLLLSHLWSLPPPPSVLRHLECYNVSAGSAVGNSLHLYSTFLKKPWKTGK